MRSLVAVAALALAGLVGGTAAHATSLKIEITGDGANGTVIIDLFEDKAPNHIAQITGLVREGAYDNVIFHRVIDGFMAQTGDVQFGRVGGDMRGVGMGKSDRPNLKAEISDIPFDRGIVGMARAQPPDSANSQFFIMYAPAPHLTGLYTVIGKVTEGMDVVDAITRGDGSNGVFSNATPDVMAKVTVID
jgi:peptidylprolyl isomerase